jgi:hypothetical protein
MTVAPGVRWIKTPAASSPVWVEQPERIAALAMLTGLGVLVSAVIQRPVRLDLHTHGQWMRGNQGDTAIPTAAVGLSWCAPVAMVQGQRGNTEVHQVYGGHNHHLMIGDALGLDRVWYEAPPAQPHGEPAHTP